MNSSVVNILEILNAATTLDSLGFSSGYNFDEEKSDNYFNELIDNSKSSTDIFSGIIIIENSDEDNGVFTVVDGLQRITTLSLLLAAICEAYRNTTSKNEDARQKIYTRYLINEKGELKLKLSEKENKIFRKLVISIPVKEAEADSGIYQAFKFFLSKIVNKEITATKLFNIITRVKFLVVFADKSEVPAREIYQALNESKADLSQINLISSFVSQFSQEASEIWDSIIAKYKKLGLLEVLKFFVRDFLTVQNNGGTPKESRLYKSFKAYFNKMSQYKSPEEILEYMSKYSRFYLKILQADFSDFEIQNLVIALNENQGQDAYPYLMEVIDDLESGHIDRAVFLDILTMIKEFVFTRIQGGNSSASMDFASLSCELNKMIAFKRFQEEFVEDDSQKESLSSDNPVNNGLTINDINQNSTFDV